MAQRWPDHFVPVRIADLAEPVGVDGPRRWQPLGAGRAAEIDEEALAAPGVIRVSPIQGEDLSVWAARALVAATLAETDGT